MTEHSFAPDISCDPIDVYLDAVERAMTAAHAPRTDRLQVLQDLEAQIADMLAQQEQPLTDEAVCAVIAGLEPPSHFAENYGAHPSRAKQNQLEQRQLPRPGGRLAIARPSSPQSAAPDARWLRAAITRRKRTPSRPARRSNFDSYACRWRDHPARSSKGVPTTPRRTGPLPRPRTRPPHAGRLLHRRPWRCSSSSPASPPKATSSSQSASPLSAISNTYTSAATGNTRPTPCHRSQRPPTTLTKSAQPPTVNFSAAMSMPAL